MQHISYAKATLLTSYQTWRFLHWTSHCIYYCASHAYYTPYVQDSDSMSALQRATSDPWVDLGTKQNRQRQHREVTLADHYIDGGHSDTVQELSIR